MSQTRQDAADRLLRTDAAARWLAVSKSTLVRWRQSGKGPDVCRLADGLPRYRAADVERWLAARPRQAAARPRPNGPGNPTAANGRRAAHARRQPFREVPHRPGQERACRPGAVTNGRGG